MLAVDTNVVVRYLLEGDDPAQFAKAVALIEGGREIFVAATVLLETDWVLRSVYGFSRMQVAGALHGFIGLPGINVENANGVRQALAWVEAGLDFADALHVAGAHQCEAFVTFDRALAKSAKALVAPTVRLA